MKPFAWSLTATGMAAALFVVGGNGFSDEGLRTLGAAGGAALAIFAATFGTARARRGRSGEALGVQSGRGERARTPRFRLERRHAPRHVVRLPVQLAIDGHSYTATLVSVSARGALLRLTDAPGTRLQAQIGQPVRIADYPAGTLARIGNRGIYVDFAVHFEPAPAPRITGPTLVDTLPGRIRRI